jgi:hypothetical protein
LLLRSLQSSGADSGTTSKKQRCEEAARPVLLEQLQQHGVL